MVNVIAYDFFVILTGRGTSAMEGLSIAWAVMEHLHNVIGTVSVYVYRIVRLYTVKLP